jgi:hypothetical protein
MTPDPGGLLDRVAAILDDGGVAFALIGAAALAVHGVSRSTLDLDLLVTDARVLDPAFWATLSTTTGTTITIRRGDARDPLAGVIRIQTPADYAVDVVVGRPGWQHDLLARAERLQRGGRQVPAVRADDLILLKLYAGGSQDCWDIEQLLDGPDGAMLAAAVETRLGDLPTRAGQLWRSILDRRRT